MGDQLTTSAEALRLFFTDDVYLVNDDAVLPVVVPAAAVPVVEQVTVKEIPVAVPVVDMTAVPEAAPVTFKYLGKNQKNVLILVHDVENEVSTERGRELLRNLVKAIQLTANDFALLNYTAYAGTKLDDFSSFFSSRLVLAFGVTPVQLGMEERAQHMLHRHGTMQLVFSGNLDQLAADQDGKKTLWGSLKQIQL